MTQSHLDSKGRVSARSYSVSHVRVAAMSDEGGRERNEDSFVALDLTHQTSFVGPAAEVFDVGPRGTLLAVADGMGGHADGNVASAMAIEGLARAMTEGPEPQPGPVFLHEAMQQAHRHVWSVSGTMSHAERMGTTLTALHVRGRVAHVANIGDSRAYVLRDGVLHRLTRDQTYTQSLIDTGVLRADEAHLSPFPHVILQAVGHNPKLRVSLATLELRQRDALLLCSDGLTNALTDERIAEIILAAPSLDAAAAELVTLAVNPPDDNVTVVLAGVSGPLPPVTRGERLKDTLHVLQEFGTRRRDGDAAVRPPD